MTGNHVLLPILLCMLLSFPAAEEIEIQTKSESALIMNITTEKDKELENIYSLS